MLTAQLHAPFEKHAASRPRGERASVIPGCAEEE
jgi:hypothetical protein